jgi:uncharacterized protein
MLVRHDATLNLASLLRHAPGDGAETEGEGLLVPEAEVLERSGLRLDGPIAWQLTVIGTGGDDDFVLQGDIRGRAVQECRRCLIDVTSEVEADIVYPMVYRPGTDGLTLLESEGEDDLLAFGRPEVDFAPLLTQIFAVEQPLAALCREDCKGLSMDGVNLNDHPDHVDPTESDAPESASSPFASLRDLDL